MSFTAAGLVCRNNESLNLISDPMMRRLVCGGTLVAAGTVGALRIIADRHYTSDVIVGGIVGFLTGYSLPLLLHRTEAEERVQVTLLPNASGDTTMQISYSF